MKSSEGTFQRCTNCKEKINCCQSFDQINPPTVSEDESKILSEQYLSCMDKRGEKLYSIKTVNNTCVFYKNNMCEIYDIRPLDCRLYPFDIIKENNKYYLIMYKLNCNHQEDFINDMKNVDVIIEKIKPWIDIFTDQVNFTKMKNKEYVIIKEILKQ